MENLSICLTFINDKMWEKKNHWWKPAAAFILNRKQEKYMKREKA